MRDLLAWCILCGYMTKLIVRLAGRDLGVLFVHVFAVEVEADLGYFDDNVVDLWRCNPGDNEEQVNRLCVDVNVVKEGGGGLAIEGFSAGVQCFAKG